MKSSILYLWIAIWLQWLFFFTQNNWPMVMHVSADIFIGQICSVHQLTCVFGEHLSTPHQRLSLCLKAISVIYMTYCSLPCLIKWAVLVSCTVWANIITRVYLCLTEKVSGLFIKFHSFHLEINFFQVLKKYKLNLEIEESRVPLILQ